MTHKSSGPTTKVDMLKTLLDRPILAIGLLLLALTMGACAFFEGVSRLEVGMFERGGHNESNATFGTLRGSKRWSEQLEDGQSLEMEFAADLEKGGLTVRVVNPQEAVIWQYTVSEGESKQTSTMLEDLEAGRYQIEVIGKNAGGNYQLEWQPR